MSTKYPKGSLWRKWDLHVHTPHDHEWIAHPPLHAEQDRQNYAKQYVEFALNEQLSVLAITDHNFCNDLSGSLLPHIIEEAETQGITILPGFEITVKDGSGIHLLVIFKEDTELTSIFKVVERCFPPSSQLIPPTGQIPVSSKSMDELKAELDESKLEYLLIFAHADRENGVLDGGTIDGTRRVQEWQKQYVGICQLSKAPEKYSTGFLHSIVSKTNTHYKRNMAYITASDCRSIDRATLVEGRHYLGQKFIWLKADPTFEGLRQIIFEPELRIRIQEQEPNEKIPYNVIDEVRFVMDSAADKADFTPAPIHLNPDLNVIIGGKSSGKSLLLYNIASTVDSNQTCLKEEGSEEKKKDKYGFKAKNIDFEVTWKNGAKQLLSQSTALVNTNNRSNYSILYVPQSYIQTLADTEGKKTRKYVGKIIRDILLQSEIYKKHYQDFITEVKRLDTSREHAISQYMTALDVYKASISSIHGIGDKTAISTYVGELRTRIQELKQKSTVSAEEQQQYNLHRERLQTLNTHRFELTSDRSKVEEFKSYADRVIGQLIVGKNQLLTELKNDTVKGAVEHIVKSVDSIKTIANDLETRVLDSQFGAITLTDEVLVRETLQTEEAVSPLAKRFSDREEIEKLEQQVIIELSKLDKISAYEGEVTIKEQQKDGAKSLLLEEYRKTHQQYLDIVQKLNERGTEVGAGLQLKGSVKFYTKRFYERLRGAINNTQSASLLSSHPLFKPENDINDVADSLALEVIITELSALFDAIIDGSMILKGSVSKKDALNALFKDDYFDYWEILVGRDEIANMSPGKAGLVLLKLLIELSDSKCPILIDQPEDNLDNRSIYSDLVNYIRTKKSQRQFIVVTHNPNIVVGADAENVIVANQNDQDPARKNATYQFDYTSGSLENTSNRDESIDDILTCMGIREHVTEILEGGKEAFQKREAKYRYSSINH